MITITNMIGAILLPIFGYFVGLTHTDVFREQVIKNSAAQAKHFFHKPSFPVLAVTGLLDSALWLCYGAKDAAGKILSIWFPVTIFVAIDSSIVSLTVFVIPAAIFEGEATWKAFVLNFIPVYLGKYSGCPASYLDFIILVIQQKCYYQR